MFCQTEEKEIQLTQTPEQLRRLIHVSEDASDLFNEVARDNLLESLSEFKGFVEGYFNPGSVDPPDFLIGEILENQNAIVEDTSRKYKRVKKWGQFWKLFKKGKINKANELGIGMDEIILYIEFKHIIIDKIVEEREDDDGQPLNMIARVSFKYHIMRSNTSLAENQGGGGSGEFLHRNICDWF
jgi:hypothetical protein